MPSIRSYDAVIIGTGQAGNPLARSLDPLGPEDGRGRARGESRRELHRAWVHSHQDHGRERVAYLARRAPDYGVSTGEVAVDLVKVRQRKRDIVDRFSGAARRGLEEKENVDLIFGEASFSAPHEVKVQARTGDELHLKAPLVFINTGTRTPIPDIPGLADVPYLTNATIMELGETPEHLVVLGGGYIGLEFAQMFRRFGARVTVVQSGSQVLPREDEDVATELARILREDGVDVLLSAEPVSAARDGERAVRVQVATPEGKRELLATALLVATGQAPNTDRLQLEAAGIERDREGFIRVNHRLETNVPGVYALGDVKGGPAFTHILLRRLPGGGSQSAEGETRASRTASCPTAFSPTPSSGASASPSARQGSGGSRSGSRGSR